MQIREAARPWKVNRDIERVHCISPWSPAPGNHTCADVQVCQSASHPRSGGDGGWCSEISSVSHVHIDWWLLSDLSMQLLAVILLEILVAHKHGAYLCPGPQTLESRLKTSLPEDLGEALSNGTVLCQLVNQIRPRSVSIIHIPSPAVVSADQPIPASFLLNSTARAQKGDIKCYVSSPAQTEFS